MTVSRSLAASILARDGAACVYCGRTEADAVSIAVDHVTPQAWFLTPGFAVPYGVDDPGNLAACCGFCNSLKRDMDLDVFALYLRRRFGMNTRALVVRVRRQLRMPMGSPGQGTPPT